MKYGHCFYRARTQKSLLPNKDRRNAAAFLEGMGNSAPFVGWRDLVWTSLFDRASVQPFWSRTWNSKFCAFPFLANSSCVFPPKIVVVLVFSWGIIYIVDLFFPAKPTKNQSSFSLAKKRRNIDQPSAKTQSQEELGREEWRYVVVCLFSLSVFLLSVCLVVFFMFFLRFFL